MIFESLTLAADTAAATAADPGTSAQEPLTLSVVVSAIFIMLGTLFCAISAVGILRMPDTYTRMQASAKAGTLGVVCIMLAAAANFAGTDEAWAVTIEALLVIIFIFLTTPSAAHLIARAAYVADTPIWDATGQDDLRACYRGSSQELLSSPEPAPSN